MQILWSAVIWSHICVIHEEASLALSQSRCQSQLSGSLTVSDIIPLLTVTQLNTWGCSNVILASGILPAPLQK